VKDGDDLQTITSHSVGDHVPRVRHDEFPSAGDAAGTTEIGQFSKALNSGEQSASDSIGGVRIVVRDIRAEVSQVVDGSRRPDDGHTRGAFRTR